jgi:hypothetical protein
MSAGNVFARYTEALDRADLVAMAALVHDAFRLECAGLDGIGKQAFLAAIKAQIVADLRSYPSLVRFFYISSANIRIVESECRYMIRVIFKYSHIKYTF